MTESRRLLQHFVAAIAYRTQKALREAPAGFADAGLMAPTTDAPDAGWSPDQPPMAVRHSPLT